jgi:RNA polymerase sigma-70 factor (ECF subfamily)
MHANQMLHAEQKETKDAARYQPGWPTGISHCPLVPGGQGFFKEHNGSATRDYFRLRPGNDTAHEEEQIRQLMRNVADGDAEAFWRLWDLYKGHLYHLCLWQMGGVRDDAEEALSRTMLKALDKLPSNGYRIQNLKAWLSRLTLNLCVDLHRERRRQLRRLESIEDVWWVTCPPGLIAADSIEETFLNREIFTYLCHAVNELPSRLREPFVMRFFQEMAYCDIAESLILSTENVRKRIQQARDILRERLKRIRQVSRPAPRRSRRAIAAKPFAVSCTVIEQAVKTST